MVEQNYYACKFVQIKEKNKVAYVKNLIMLNNDNYFESGIFKSCAML